jgi:DNA polymerase-4
MEQLTALFGEGGEHFWRLARGLDDRLLTPDSQAKSIGQEITFAQNLPDRDELRAVLLGQAEQVARRCRRHGLKARTVNVKIRYGDFKTINRSRTLGEPTDLTDELWSLAKTLFNEWADKGFKPVRLIGVTAENLQPAGGVQPLLFDDKDRKKKDRLDRTVDEINERFGNGSIGRGGATRREEAED